MTGTLSVIGTQSGTLVLLVVPTTPTRPLRPHGRPKP